MKGTSCEKEHENWVKIRESLTIILESCTIRQNHCEFRGVLIFLNFWQFSLERTQTESLGTTVSEFWIDNFMLKQKNYRPQTPQNLALTKIIQRFRKTSTLKVLSNLQEYFLNFCWSSTKCQRFRGMCKVLSELVFVLTTRFLDYHPLQFYSQWGVAADELLVN